jgi:peroxiredoxin Q/BCP
METDKMNYNFSILIALLFLIFASFFYTSPAEEDQGFQKGDKVPSFCANDQNGDLWCLEDHLGKDYMVIYFYPAAMTGGCTKQACGYRDDKSILNELNVKVVGISADPVNNLKVFKESHNLNFTLLSDVNGDIARLFDIPLREGSSFSQKIDNKTVNLSRAYSEARWTFIVDTADKVVYIDTEVDAENDSKNIIDFLKTMDK